MLGRVGKIYLLAPVAIAMALIAVGATQQTGHQAPRAATPAVVAVPAPVAATAASEASGVAAEPPAPEPGDPEVRALQLRLRDGGFDPGPIDGVYGALTARAERRSRGEPDPTPPVATPAGGHTDAWWHGVAICEQGGRNDPYFGYFSFMDGSAGGKPWDVQVAMGNALLARVGHEIGPWAESCVRAGYAASPGG